MKRRLPENSIVNEIILITTAMCVFCLNTVATQSCRPRPKMVLIQIENCRSVTRLIRACEGTCNSYSRPSVQNLGELERTCKCCQVTHFLRRRLDLKCEREGEDHTVTIRTYLKIPIVCQCRPCFNSVSSVVPAEDNIWNRGKRHLNDTVTVP